MNKLTDVKSARWTFIQRLLSFLIFFHTDLFETRDSRLTSDTIYRALKLLESFYGSGVFRRSLAFNAKLENPTACRMPRYNKNSHKKRRIEILL